MPFGERPYYIILVDAIYIYSYINACLYRFLYPLLRDGGFGTG